MDRIERDRLTADGDPGAGSVGSADEQDTQGSSMATYQLGWSVVAERQRQAAEAARDAGRAREAREHRRATGRSLKDRLLGR